MMKKILTLAMALTTAATTAAYIPAKTQAEALSPPIYGDANLDWQLNIADLVTFQNYLLGRYEFDANQLFYCDMNKDGSTDIFDYVLLKKQLETPSVRFETRFTAVDTGNGDKYICGEEQAMIRSVKELEEYFTAPGSGAMRSGNENDHKVASDEVIADFKAKYDEEFFSGNALMLCYIDGGKYKFNSVRYVNDDVKCIDAGKIVAEICDITPYDIATADPTPPVIAQVTIPKDFVGNVYDMEFEWKVTAAENSSAPDPEEELTAKAVTELIASATDAAYREAMAESDPVVAESYDELKEYLENHFYSAVVRGILKEYDEKFFDSNVLILTLAYQSGSDYRQLVAEPVISGDAIKLTYSLSGELDEMANGVVLSRIAVKKEQYKNRTVIREHMNGTPIAAEHRELADDRYAMNYDNLNKVYIEGWFTDKDALHKAITDMYCEEMFNDLEPDTIDWDSKAVYAWLDDGICTAKHPLLNAYLSGRSITPTFISDPGLGDIAGLFVHLLIVDKEYAGREVSPKFYNYSDSLPHYDGERKIVDFSCSPTIMREAFMFNEYTYKDEHSIEVYTLGTGAGFVPYAGYTHIGSIQIPAGDSIIDPDSCDGEFTNDSDDSALYTEENYTVRFIRGEKTNKVILSFGGNDYEIEYNKK